MSKTVDILGVKISRLGFSEALEACAASVTAGSGGYVCFANVHTVTEAHQNPAIEAAMNGALFAVADGVPLVWTSWWKAKSIGSRVCGPDFMKEFLRQHPDQVHGLIGGASGQAERLASEAQIQAVCYSPPMRGFSPENAQEDWNHFLTLCPGGVAPAIVWIGLGAPKQELWMREVSRLAPKTLFFGVGAAFDFLTGSKNRAPVWMQKSALEWLYRLIQEPGRLWKRYLVGNSVFLYLLMGEAFPLHWALVGFMALSLFAPPFSYGLRSVFLGDLWAFLWVPFFLGLALLKNRANRPRILRSVLSSALIFVVIYLHGYWRPSLVEPLAHVDLVLTEPDGFLPLKEAVVGFRFLIWFWAAVAVGFSPLTQSALRSLQRTFAVFMGIAAISMYAAKFDFSISKELGQIYGYDPLVFPWAGRIYGIFRSPIEAGATLGLGAVLLLGCDLLHRGLRGVGTIFLAGAVVTSQTMSAVISWAAIGLTRLNALLSWRQRAFASIVTLCSAGVFHSLTINSQFARGKTINFIYRFGPWKVYWEAALSRWDSFLFGFGFPSYHVDNFYIFLFNRGGLLLFGSFFAFALRTLVRSWSDWSWSQRSIVIYLAVSSLTLDTLILRPVIALLIAVAIPLMRIQAPKIENSRA